MTIKALRSDGVRTRQVILDTAVDLASAEGLEGLTIGRLAGELGMSKSGLFAHFGSKEGLQLATVDAAGHLYARVIWEKVGGTDAGLPRLVALLDLWLRFVSVSDLKGGCFFSAAAHEFDGRPGAVRDRVAYWMQRGQDTIETEVTTAITDGHIRAGCDPGQLVFELYAFIAQAVWRGQLLDSELASDRARAAIRSRLELELTPAGRTLLAGHDAGGQS